MRPAIAGNRAGRAGARRRRAPAHSPLERLDGMLYMIASRRILLSAATALIVAMPAAGQVGHPAKGSWLGYWGADDTNRNRMLLVLDWEDQQVVGTINPGRNGAAIERATIDYDDWTMTIEARLPVDGGEPAHFVATGKLENLGSWVNRRYSGTYTHGGQSGTFSLTLN